MVSRLRTALSPLLLGLLASCTGAIGEGNGTPGSGGSGNAGSGTPGAGGADPSGVGGATGSPREPGPLRAVPGWRADSLALRAADARAVGEQRSRSAAAARGAGAVGDVHRRSAGRHLLQQRAPAVHDVGVVVRLRDRRRDAVTAGGARRDRAVAGHAAAPRSPRRSFATSAGAPTGATSPPPRRRRTARCSRRARPSSRAATRSPTARSWSSRRCCSRPTSSTGWSPARPDSR